MLIRLVVENFRSIDESIELSTVALDEERDAARRADSLDASLLTTVGIFGPNASGKTNVLVAIDWLRHAVTRSLVAWDEGIPVDPFAFGDRSEHPTSFIIEYLIDSVRFEYQLEVTRSEVVYEGLFHYPNHRRRRVFERAGLDLKLQDGLGELSGVRQLLTERSLVLSLTRRFKEPLTSKFSAHLVRTRSMGLPRYLSSSARFGFGPARSWRGPTELWIESIDAEAGGPDEQSADAIPRQNELRQRGLALLRMADLGIVDVEMREDDLDDTRPSRRRPVLIHQANGRQYPLEMTQESAGTQTWFRLVGPLLDALASGGVLVFDEIDASLHPKLSAEVLGLFANPRTNPLNAQLIFTSHDPSLLARLNRDQIWLTDKDEGGSTQLTPLTDFGGDRVRKSQNLEKAYLEGRFGGIPEVDLLGLYNALGLIGS